MSIFKKILPENLQKEYGVKTVWEAVEVQKRRNRIARANSESPDEDEINSQLAAAALAEQVESRKSADSQIRLPYADDSGQDVDKTNESGPPRDDWDVFDSR